MMRPEPAREPLPRYGNTRRRQEADTGEDVRYGRMCDSRSLEKRALPRFQGHMMDIESLLATRDELIRNLGMRPHVVILGAGASRAACPQGDRNGLRLPTMDDLVEILPLRPLIIENGIDDPHENFEAIYSKLSSDDSKMALTRKIETVVHDYFSSLELPDRPTIYDHLLLSLRKKDAVFTFNWDPFLFEDRK